MVNDRQEPVEAALRLLLTDLVRASAIMEAEWADHSGNYRNPTWDHWNACIDAASGYLAKDGPAPVNESAR